MKIRFTRRIAKIDWLKQKWSWRSTSLIENYLWDYVESGSNPADILSRGLTPLHLTADHEWFSGLFLIRTSKKPWTDQITFSPSFSENEKIKSSNGIVMILVPFKSDILILLASEMQEQNLLKGILKQDKIKKNDGIDGTFSAQYPTLFS